MVLGSNYDAKIRKKRKDTKRGAKWSDGQVASIWYAQLWKYPARLDEAMYMTTKDVAFCLIMWFGLSQVDVYIIAYRPRANRNSMAAMASRKAKEDWAIEYLNRLSDLWYEDKLKFK